MRGVCERGVYCVRGCVRGYVRGVCERGVR